MVLSDFLFRQKTDDSNLHKLIPISEHGCFAFCFTIFITFLYHLHLEIK